MKNIRKAIPGEKNYQQPGYFVMDGIVTFRCEQCFQHMSLREYAISKKGLVTPDVVCTNCGNIHVEVKLTEHDTKLSKAKKATRLK